MVWAVGGGGKMKVMGGVNFRKIFWREILAIKDKRWKGN